ncbi:MAG: crotonase/enoyl-CoA hydratase family protein [Deltaproteobacteria bacterium]
MSLLTFDLQDKVAVIGLNRAEKRNAISDAVIEELAERITEASAKARAGVIFGHGPHFSSGLDLAEHVKKTAFEGVQGSRRWHEIFGQLQLGTLPWFGALHGAVVGGGLELAASLHVRVADETAFFGLPEGQRGIFVGGGGSVRIARLMGVARMSDLMLTGRTIDANRAEAWNVVQYVVPEGAALAKATELAGKAASNADISNYAIINALPRIQDMSRDDGLFVESFIASFTATSPEAEERLNAFLEKRAAKVTRPDK